MKNKEPSYIFPHMPKCAGTTIAYHLKHNLKREEVFFLYHNHGFFYIIKNKYEYFKLLRKVKE